MITLIFPALATPAVPKDLYVSTKGSDAFNGTRSRPFSSLSRALKAVAARPNGQPVTVHVDGGTYYLSEPLTFTPLHSGTAKAPVTIMGSPNQKVVLSGGRRLNLTWKPWRNGIYQARVPRDLETEELFINGSRQVLARYPNFNPNERIFNGYAEDAIAKERVARWANPAGGYFHAMHPFEWGDFTWRMTGKTSDGEVALDGGWQNNRPAGPHPKFRFVENIFEELDAPGEWYLDQTSHILYYFPPAGLELTKATVEATRLRTLVQFRGTQSAPVRYINLKGFTFRHTARTFMDTRERLLRTDWAIYRGGALFYQGAENCLLENCTLDQLGGNAVFVNNYNRRLTFRTLHISRAGASGFQFVGDPKAARSALFNYEETQPLEGIDLSPGPKSDNFPADCLVDDCLIELTGRTEKQTAGVNIDLAQGITVRHCSIYDMPRAGINIGDGCWGGHVIEDCDIFDTVKETGDHGSFNSWGRDRFWNPDIEVTNRWVKAHPEMPFLDVMKPIVLRHNRWRCDHGWDIDLDDGSSNYQITENLCLNGGIKNREGYGRTVTNNVIVNNGFHPHVWYANSGDVFRSNIVWSTYAPARMYSKPWPEGLDSNFLQISGDQKPGPALSLQALSGRDGLSLAGDAMFVDPTRGDYRVRADSPALGLGFKNFRMDNFGVRSPKLKAIARTPELPTARGTNSDVSRSDRIVDWLGGKVRDVKDEGERSAFGLPGVIGVLVLEVPDRSLLASAGLHQGDVVLALNNKPTPSIRELLELTSGRGDLKVTFRRNQKAMDALIRRP